MILRHAQYELFKQNDDSRRLIYFGAFGDEAANEHRSRIEDLEKAKDDNAIDQDEIAKLKEGINELKAQIKELLQLLHLEEMDASGLLPRDPIAVSHGYGDKDDKPSDDTDSVAFKNTGSFVNDELAALDATNFEANFALYKTAFENIGKMDFTEQMTDWLPTDKDGAAMELSDRIYETPISDFADLLADGTVSPSADVTISLYNEHGLSIDVPANTTEKFEVRPQISLRYAFKPNHFLIPITYGGQDLYVSTENLTLPTLSVTNASSGDSFQYTLPANAAKGLAETKFTLKANVLAPDSLTWKGLIKDVVFAYQIEKNGGMDKYKVELFNKGVAKLQGTPNLGRIYEAWAIAAITLNDLDGRYADAYYLLARAMMEAAKIEQNIDVRKNEINGYITSYEALPAGPGKTSDQQMAKLKNELLKHEATSGGEIAEHDAATLGLLGGDTNILYSTTLRLSLQALKDKATADGAIDADINKYGEKRLELAKAMKIEKVFANEYLAKVESQPMADLLELYFTMKANGDISAVLTAQLAKEEGGILASFSADKPIIQASVGSLARLVGILVDTQIESRIDHSESIFGEIKFKDGDLALATAAARQLFVTDSETFKNLDTNGDGILIISMGKKVYAISKGYESGDTRELKMDYIGKGGKYKTESFKAPSGILGAIAESMAAGKGADRKLRDGLIAAATLPDMQQPAVATTASAVKNGREKDTSEFVTKLTVPAAAPAAAPAPTPTTATPASTSITAAPAALPDPLGSLIARLSGKPQKPDMPQISVGATPEEETAIREERMSLGEKYGIDLQKWEVEKKVYRCNRNLKITEVFKKAPVEQLEKFYQEINDMRTVKTPGDERRGYRQNWAATFLAITGETKGDNLHLIGRPLILYNMIRRAHQVAETYKLNVVNHGTGDQWLYSMGKKKYEIMHGEASNVENLPDVDTANPGRIEGFGGLLGDMRADEFKQGETRAYSVRVTNDPDEFPFIFKVERVAGGFKINYGKGNATIFEGNRLQEDFIKRILQSELNGARNNWSSLHSFRLGAPENLTDANLRDYNIRFTANKTTETLDREVDEKSLAVKREIAKASGLPMPELNKLLDRNHSELFSRVWAILTGVKKLGPGPKTLTEAEFKAAKIYLELLDYKLISEGYEEGEVSEKAAGKGSEYLREYARDEWEKRDDVTFKEDKKDKKSGRLAGKESAPVPSRRPDPLERLESLGLRGRMARRARKMYLKFADDLWKKSGGLDFHEMERNRYGVLARNSAAMDNNLGLEFDRMAQRAEGIKASLMRKGLDLRGNIGAVITRDNSVDDALLRMAALAVRGENAELPCSVAYVMGDSDRAGSATVRRGEGYASPRVRRSVYRPYV